MAGEEVLAGMGLRAVEYLRVERGAVEKVGAVKAERDWKAERDSRVELGLRVLAGVGADFDLAEDSVLAD
jgi:hypothetical protein